MSYPITYILCYRLGLVIQMQLIPAELCLQKSWTQLNEDIQLKTADRHMNVNKTGSLFNLVM